MLNDNRLLRFITRQCSKLNALANKMCCCPYFFPSVFFNIENSRPGQTLSLVSRWSGLKLLSFGVPPPLATCRPIVHVSGPGDSPRFHLLLQDTKLTQMEEKTSIRLYCVNYLLYKKSVRLEVKESKKLKPLG